MNDWEHVASAQTAARFERERDALDDENLRLREQAGEFDGVHYLRLALTRTREDQATATFRRETLVQAVRQFAELEAELTKVRGHRAELAERCYRKDLELDEWRTGGAGCDQPIR